MVYSKLVLESAQKITAFLLIATFILVLGEKSLISFLNVD